MEIGYKVPTLDEVLNNRKCEYKQAAFKKKYKNVDCFEVTELWKPYIQNGPNATSKENLKELIESSCIRTKLTKEEVEEERKRRYDNISNWIKQDKMKKSISSEQFIEALKKLHNMMPNNYDKELEYDIKVKYDNSIVRYFKEKNQYSLKSLNDGELKVWGGKDFDLFYETIGKWINTSDLVDHNFDKYDSLNGLIHRYLEESEDMYPNSCKEMLEGIKYGYENNKINFEFINPTLGKLMKPIFETMKTLPKKEKIKLNKNITKVESSKLVCIKSLITGKIERIDTNSALNLVNNKHSHYIYCPKNQWKIQNNPEKGKLPVREITNIITGKEWVVDADKAYYLVQRWPARRVFRKMEKQFPFQFKYTDGIKEKISLTGKNIKRKRTSRFEKLQLIPTIDRIVKSKVRILIPDEIGLTMEKEKERSEFIVKKIKHNPELYIQKTYFEKEYTNKNGEKYKRYFVDVDYEKLVPWKYKGVINLQIPIDILSKLKGLSEKKEYKPNENSFDKIEKKIIKKDKQGNVTEEITITSYKRKKNFTEVGNNRIFKKYKKWQHPIKGIVNNKQLKLELK
jgi:CheY-specific phosphatase CheX